jgi:SPOR domain
MADRYQERPFPADDYDRDDDPHTPARDESDPLAELARLIGQSESSGIIGRANLQVRRRSSAPDQDPTPPDSDLGAISGPPSWLQRANRQAMPPVEDSEADYPSAVHPLQRYATARSAPEPEYQEPHYDNAPEQDPSRYDNALYGQINDGLQQYQHEQAYAEDRHAYEGYDDGAVEQVRKRGGIFTVMVVLALAIVGTGAAFAYRTYAGSPRSGEPPIIKADTSPTKVVPAPSDAITKVPDRMAAGDAIEKIVPREEAPVDVAKAAPRVVFPSLSQNGNAPTAASVAPAGSPLANAANGTLPNSEPRKIKTLTVRGDQPDGAAVPVTSGQGAAGKQVPARAGAALPTAVTRNPASANASASAPLSLVPQAGQAAADTKTRLADTNPVQNVPGTGASGGGYLVQVSSQRNEADAQASYRALQGKFPTVLGSHGPLIKRADLGEKGVYYRAMVGPFGTPEEASQFCGNLKTAGGQCVVQRN